MHLELTRKTEQAARALAFLVLHAGDDHLKGTFLADWLESTINYLPQIMKPMIDAGWIESVTGPTGGYRATPLAESVSMFELIEAIEGPVVSGQCVLRGAPCPATEPCALHEAWSRARKALIDELSSTKVVEGALPTRPRPGNLKGDTQ